MGQFALASQGYSLHSLQHILRVNDTQVIGSRIVNETHFQTMQQAYLQTPASQLPQINVIGAFTGGGSNEGSLNYHHHHYELDNDTSISLNKHFVKFGARLRTVVEPYLTTGDFNGTYTFSSLNAYQVTQRGLAQGLMPAQIAALGGGPTQFTRTIGQPFVRIFAEDTGVYFADDWRLRLNFRSATACASKRRTIWRPCRFGSPSRHCLGNRPRIESRSQDGCARTGSSASSMIALVPPSSCRRKP